jgi:hypothetical protein
MCVRRENRCCHREGEFRNWWTTYVAEEDEFIIFQVLHLAIAVRKAEAKSCHSNSKSSNKSSVWSLLLLLLLLLSLTLIVRLGWYRG